MNSKLHISLLALASLSLLATGCSDSEDNRTEPFGVARASLTKAQDCNDLESRIKADALAKMNARIDAEIAMWDGGGWAHPTPDYDMGAPEAGNSQGTGGTGSSNDARQQESAKEYSGTNTQVDGVDEADIVKTDGKYLYLLHGQSFLVLNAWPATQLAQSSSFAVEGTPSEMYVTDDGKVVIYSNVNGTAIYAAAGISPRNSYDDSYYGYYSNGAEPYPGAPEYMSNPLTKITVLQLQNAQPTVLSETYFEGSYVSSRRVGSHVRTVLEGASFGPNLSYWPDDYPSTKTEWVAAYEKLRTENAAKIRNSTLSDWLPYSMVRSETGVQAHLARCDEFYVPTTASTVYGMTQIQSLDLAAPQLPPVGVSIIGAVDTVYSNLDTLVIAARAWVDPTVYSWGTSRTDGDGVVSSPPMADGVATTRQALTEEPISTAYTHLHSFDLTFDPLRPQYVASGTVVGTILNQFSLDVHNGNLRVATTDERVNVDWDNRQTNHVFILSPQNDELQIVGSLRNLAPTERIYSARFMGDRGYLVTFRQVDPLFVLDLANPAAPAVLGELKIPGFSEYMHPLDSNHLLTIGQDDGLALQIFDVSDPVNPVQKHKYVFSNEQIYGYSEAQTNHKAFTYYDSHGLLAFPFVGWDNAGKMRSTLELFDVNKDTGFHRRGGVDHTALFDDVKDPYGYCGGYYGVDVRRGLFLEDFVYSISYGGVVVNHIDDLNNPVASFALEAPTNTSYPGCYGNYEMD